EEVGALALHPSTSVLAVGDDAGDVHLFDLAAAKALPPLIEAHTNICSSVAFSPSREWELSTAGMDCVCAQWDYRRAIRCSEWCVWEGGMQGGGQVLNPRHVHCLSYSPDGHHLALALGDGSLELREVGKGEVVASATPHRAAVSQAHFAPELGRGGGGAVPIITAGDDAQLQLWTAEALLPPPDFGGSKRQRGCGGAVGSVSEPSALTSEENDVSEGLCLRQHAAVGLPLKPNWIAAASAGSAGVGVHSQEGIVCVASNSPAIDVFRVQGSTLS
ncbi:MAG: hypothetical protein SGPRY_001304, partial [Prymnesium sp.]